MTHEQQIKEIHTMFAIKKSIPIPKIRRKKSEFVVFLGSMEVGDCVEVPREIYRKAHISAKNAGIKIRCRADNQTYRVWRIG